MKSLPEAAIREVSTSAYRIPTDAPEADGTAQWDATTLVLAQIKAGRETGIGFTYCDAAAAGVLAGVLRDVLVGQEALDIPARWQTMVAAVRNSGWRGIAASAISAADWALWDLKAKLLGLPLLGLVGAARPRIALYGSGGFTSYSTTRLVEQMTRWTEELGCGAVKMKTGSEPAEDLQRVRQVRRAIGRAQLYVDANGALTRKQALWFADHFAEMGVTWFEEPVSSDDLEGLRLLRDRAPAPVEIAAGEYGYEPFYFRRLLEAGAVDILQADATRCCGLTGFMKAAALAEAHGLDLSSHTAPALHVHAGCAAPRFRIAEWFHDHVRIEQLLFDGSPVPEAGHIAPDLSRPGLGLALKPQDAAPYAL
jgi:L-alanine-DL-glutamate epimerase-like enolase superfamily enzyme